MRYLIWILFMAALAGGVWYLRFRPEARLSGPARTGPIVALGDSLTYGVGAGPGESYPDQLARLIGRPVVNRGVSGNTVAQGAARMDSEVLPLKPSMVIVLLGANDFLRQMSLDDAFGQLETLVKKLQASGAMVVLVGMEGWVPGSGVGGRFKALAKKLGCPYVADVMGGITGHADYLSDQVHPNGKGYKLMAERVAAVVKPYLQEK